MDLDVVAGGEPADHEEAEPVAVEEVEVLGPGDADVGLGEALPAHAEPPVLDLQGVAVADGFAADAHLGVGRGELGGVLDEFGQEVGEVGDGTADDGRLGEPGHLHARVVLDFGDGGADHVGEGDGPAPGAAGGGAGEDDQALRVASHAGGEVVEPEEVVEFAGVVGAPLHGVQEVELAVDEDLAAPGEVDEDAGDAVGEFGAFDGGGEGRAVDGGEGFADLADLVLGAGSDRRLGPDVDLLAGAQPAHGGGEFAARDAEGGVAEADELDDEAAPDPYGDEEGGHDGREAEGHRGAPGGEGAPGEGVGAVGSPGAGAGLDRGEPVAYGGEGDVPVGGGDRPGGGATGARGPDQVLRAGESGVVGAGGEPDPRGAFGGGQVGGGRGDEGAAGLDGSGEGAQPVGGELAGEVGGAEEGVLAGQHLARPAEFQEYARVGSPFGVLDAAEGAADGEGGGDRPGVLGVHLVPVGPPLGRGGTEQGEALDLADERAHAVRDLVGQVPGVADGVGRVQAEPVDGRVRAALPVLELGGPGGAGGRDLAYGGAPFGLECREGGRHGLPDLGVEALEPVETGDVLGGGDGGEAPQGEERDDRDHQERDDLGADRTGTRTGARGGPDAVSARGGRACGS